MFPLQFMMLTNILFVGICIFIENTNEQSISMGKMWASSSCLIHDKDYITFRGLVETHGRYEHLNSLQYELQPRDSDYNPMCFIDLLNCKNMAQEDCYCRETEERDLFEVFINLTVKGSISEAKIRGKLTYTDEKVHSKEMKLPKIYDPDLSVPRLFINEENINLDYPKAIINRNDVSILLLINNEVDYPGQLKIINITNNITIMRQYHFLQYSMNIFKTQTFFFTYDVCYLPEYTRNFTITIESSQDADEKDTHFKDSLVSSWPIVAGISIFINVIFLAVLFYCKCYKKRKRNPNGKPRLTLVSNNKETIKEEISAVHLSMMTENTVTETSDEATGTLSILLHATATRDDQSGNVADPKEMNIRFKGYAMT